MAHEKVAYSIDSLFRSFHYLHYLDLAVYDPDDIIDPLVDLLSFGLEKG